MLYQYLNDCQETKDKVWGKEFWIANNPDYCGKVLVLNRQHRCSIHYHKIKKETFLVISGMVLLEYEGVEPDQKVILKQGMSVTIEPYQKHRFTGLASVSEIIEFSSQHFEDDSYRTIESGKVPDEEWKDIIDEY